MGLLQGGECPPGIRVFPNYLLRQNAAIVPGPFHAQAVHFFVLLDGHTSLRVPTSRQRLAHVARGVPRAGPLGEGVARRRVAPGLGSLPLRGRFTVLF